MKKVKTIIVIFTLLVNVSFLTAQTKVGDVTLPNETVLQGEKLILNGAGMREKMWIDLYAGGLYLQTKSNSSDEVVSKDAPMAIKLEIVSSMVSQSKMIGAINEGFEKSTIGAATADQKSKFTTCFSDEIVQGDIFDIVYANNTITVLKNGKSKGSLTGLEFKKTLFGIWLGNNPADKDLKKAMLGK